MLPRVKETESPSVESTHDQFPTIFNRAFFESTISSNYDSSCPRLVSILFYRRANFLWKLVTKNCHVASFRSYRSIVHIYSSIGRSSCSFLPPLSARCVLVFRLPLHRTIFNGTRCCCFRCRCFRRVLSLLLLYRGKIYPWKFPQVRGKNSTGKENGALSEARGENRFSV